MTVTISELEMISLEDSEFSIKCAVTDRECPNTAKWLIILFCGCDTPICDPCKNAVIEWFAMAIKAEQEQRMYIFCRACGIRAKDHPEAELYRIVKL